MSEQLVSIGVDLGGTKIEAAVLKRPRVVPSAVREHVSGLVFGVIMGSGVGGGVVFNGKVWAGPQNIAGEWGHHAVGPWGGYEAGGIAATLGGRPVCYCGKTGCMEMYSSGVWV